MVQIKQYSNKIFCLSMGSALSTINSIVRVCTKQRNTPFDVKNVSKTLTYTFCIVLHYFICS